MRIGFTGTHTGMTFPQKWYLRDQLRALLEAARLTGEIIEAAHHGICTGADSEFHKTVRAELPGVKIIGHTPTKRGAMSPEAYNDCDELRPPRDYLTRDRDIADEVDYLIGTPDGPHWRPRSGTWYTLKYAARLNKPLLIILPDGAMLNEIPYRDKEQK